MKTIDQLIQSNVEFAKERFKEQGDLMPTFIIHSEAGFIPVGCPFDDDDDKKSAMLRLVSLLMIKYGAYAYSIIHEAWMKKVDADTDLSKIGKLKNHADKREVLVISYVGYDRKEMRIVDVKRSEGKIELSEPEKFTGDVGGRFFDLLPPPEAVEKAKTDLKAAKGLDLIIDLICVRYKLGTIEVRAEK